MIQSRKFVKKGGEAFVARFKVSPNDLVFHIFETDSFLTDLFRICYNHANLWDPTWNSIFKVRFIPLVNFILSAFHDGFLSLFVCFYFVVEKLSPCLFLLARFWSLCLSNVSPLLHVTGVSPCFCVAKNSLHWCLR